jgi:hypothetical protein
MEEEEKTTKGRVGRWVCKLLQWIARGQAQGGVCKR